MNSESAAEHLQVIRTLMERAAVYRRALAPVMLWTGSVGILAAIAGWLADIASLRAFAIYWMAVSFVALTGAFLLTRRQALKSAEPFWTPPARRVAQALSVPLFVGLMVALLLILPWSAPMPVGWLPLVWMALYGCAVHAAGFFASSGMRWFGWCFVLCSCVIFAWISACAGTLSAPLAHGIMGLAFGGFHLAYGAYLYVTEKESNTA